MKRLFVFSAILTLLFPLQISGQTWSLLKRVTWNGGNSMYPSVAIGNGIHLTWTDNTPGNYEIFYKRSFDSGATWSANTRLVWNGGISEFPSIAVSPNNSIHVVWQDQTPGNYEIFYKRSTNNGTSWSGLTRLTWNESDSWKPNITISSDNNIHIAWYDRTPGNWEIFYKRSTTNGASWSVPTRLTWNTGLSGDPNLTADSGNFIHLVWCDNTPGNNEIFHKRSTDSGAFWSLSSRLTWNGGESFLPSITSDTTNGLHLVWCDITPGNWEIFYKRGTNRGTSWSAPTRLTWNEGDSRNPVIAAGPGYGIHLAWQQIVAGSSEIFYKQSTDSGVNWLGTTRLTWNLGESRYTSLAIDSVGGIHLMWHDNTTTNFEIFYKNRKY